MVRCKGCGIVLVGKTKGRKLCWVCADKKKILKQIWPERLKHNQHKIK